jgi:hypothetical protein
MSSLLERLGNFISSFHQRYEEFKRPRIPMNLLVSKDPEPIKHHVNIPESNTPKSITNINEHMSELFRP